MPLINREWCEIARDVITEAQEQLNAQLINPLFAELPGISAQEIAPDFFKKMRELLEFASQISRSLGARSTELPDLPGDLVPLFKGFFLRARLAKARVLDQQRSKTTNPHVIDALETTLSVFDAIIREGWFQTASPEYPLSLSDVLTLERVEELDTGTCLQERKHDEKFHLLQAPSLFLPDLHFHRAKCGVRNIPVAIAFMDIDKFKDFNTAIGHTHVNGHVLPEFMRAVEAHVYGHGYAYRMSGDEYAVLMPNADADLALGFLNGLRRRVATLRFLGTDKTLTLSVGVCVADRDCFLTDEELLQRAEQAMSFAKSKGRDCVAGFSGKLFDNSELRILAPLSATSP